MLGLPVVTEMVLPSGNGADSLQFPWPASLDRFYQGLCVSMGGCIVANFAQKEHLRLYSKQIFIDYYSRPSTFTGDQGPSRAASPSPQEHTIPKMRHMHTIVAATLRVIWQMPRSGTSSGARGAQNMGA